jgi:hypothetical protein
MEVPWKCEGCGKDIPPRYEQFNGHTVAFPYCQDCEKKMKEAVKRKT